MNLPSVMRFSPGPFATNGGLSKSWTNVRSFKCETFPEPGRTWGRARHGLARRFPPQPLFGHPVAVLLLGAQMRNRIELLLAVLLVNAGAARALTADEIVARNLEARGGATKLAAIQSLRMTGTASFTFGDAKIDTQYAQLQKRPGMARTEVSLQGLTAVDAYDGREGWQVQPFFGRRDPHRTSADEAKDLVRLAEIGGPLAAAAEKGHRIEYLGTDDLDGTSAHKLRVTRKDGDVQYVFLDPDYFLEIRVVTESKVRGVEQVTESDLGAYEQVAGVWFPFSVESGEKGKPRTFRLTIERAEPNVEADDALFRFPTGPAGRAVLAAPTAQKAVSAAPPGPPAKE